MNNDINYKPNLFEILDAIQNHIRLQDTKAEGLLTAIGIIFSFSMFSIDAIINKSSNIKILIYIFGALYLLSFLISIILLIVSLFPMRRKEDKELLFPLYAIDIYKMNTKDDFNKQIRKEINEDVLLSQIKACSKISYIKENCVRFSAFTIAASVVFLIVGIVLLIAL